MEYKELGAFFQKIERNYPVQQWTADDIHIWPLMRIHMVGEYAGKMISNRSESDASTVQMPQNGKLRGYLNLVYNNLHAELKLWWIDRKHQQTIAPCDVVMSGNSMYRNIMLPSGEYMEHNLDPLYKMLQAEGYQVFMFERIKDNESVVPRWSKSFVTNGMDFWVHVKRKLICGNVEIKIDIELYQKIMNEFSGLGTDMRNMSLDALIYQVQLLRLLAREFEKKLNSLNPRLVILDCWYSMDKMALSFAAHKLGIPVVDVQHGVGGGGGHLNYNAWSNMPSTGYEVMPDYIWAWGQDDCEAIMRWGEDKVIPILGGHPMSLVWNDSNCPYTQFYNEVYEKDFNSDRPVILFTLQWGLNYPDWITDFINRSDEYIWLIRLHPHVDDNERIFLRKLKRGNNIICDSVKNFPLEILLQKIDLHITAASSVVVDAEAAGCCSIVIDSYGRDVFAARREKEMVYYAYDSDSLLLAINKILSKPNIKNRGDCMKACYGLGRAGIQKLIEIIESR